MFYITHAEMRGLCFLINNCMLIKEIELYENTCMGSSSDASAAGSFLMGENKELNIKDEVDKFAQWAMRRLHVKNPVKIDLSYDTKDARENHHTGSHTEGSGTIWVYAKNRNLVDILRTVFHEIVHCRQSELDMIKPGDSYPGSPIEAMADMLSGKYIKIYGEKNHHIFQ